MDRQIPEQIVKQRKRKRIINISIFGILFIAVFFIFRAFSTPVVNTSNYRTCIADTGIVMTSFLSSGVIQPVYHEVITSPVQGSVEKINVLPGDLVSPEDTLIIPQITKLEQQYNQMMDEILLEEKRIERSTVELQSREEELKNNLRSDSLEIHQLFLDVENAIYLHEIGGASARRVSETQNSYDIALINRENLLVKFNSFKKLATIDLQSMQLELNLKRNTLFELKNKIDRAFLKPGINGMVLSVLVEPGQYLSEGMEVANIADMEHFKIEGSISARYSDRIFTGQDVGIKIDNDMISGKVVAIAPNVQGGKINFTVRPDDDSHQMLKPNMRCEVQFIQSINEGCIRIKNGSYYNDAGHTTLFVEKDGMLEQREVKLGGASFDYVEVVSGIEAGELVIISKPFMEKYEHHTRLKCKK